MAYNTFRQSLDYDLKNYSALTTLVTNSKIFEIDADMSTTGDYLVWQIISNPRGGKNGNVKEPFRTSRVQFSCYGTKFTSRQIADCILDRYDSFSGSIGTGTAITKVKQAFVANDVDGGRDGDLYKAIVDIIFKYNV
jgi:hypothetical protein